MSGVNTPQWIREVLRYPFALLAILVGFVVFLAGLPLLLFTKKVYEAGRLLMFLGLVLFLRKESKWA